MVQALKRMWFKIYRAYAWLRWLPEQKKLNQCVAKIQQAKEKELKAAKDAAHGKREQTFEVTKHTDNPFMDKWTPPKRRRSDDK